MDLRGERSHLSCLCVCGWVCPMYILCSYDSVLRMPAVFYAWFLMRAVTAFYHSLTRAWTDLILSRYSGTDWICITIFQYCDS